MRVKQIIAILIGLLYGVLGGIALARTGLTDLFQEANVLGLPHTTLLGYIELAYGLLMLAVGGLALGERAGVIFLGALAAGFGIVVIAAPGALRPTLGVEQANGVLYLVTGVVALAAGLSPSREPGPAEPPV